MLHVRRMLQVDIIYFFLCAGSPSLPDKAKHNREVMILLPSHRERANNTMYYNMAENGQVGQNWQMQRLLFLKTKLLMICKCAFFVLFCFVFQNNHMQRALLQQVSPCKPCADPHMNLPEKGNTQTG